MELLDPGFEVFLRIEFRNFLVPVGQRGFDLRRVDGLQQIQRQPRLDARAAT